MCIQIHQGRKAPSEPADITIVIDVIRAFTVAHYAFLQGVQKILLAETVQQALNIQSENQSYLLAGEVNGLPIEGFDLDNSPYNISNEDLVGKTLIQKTTNGVQATINCLLSDHIFVTGFTNAKATANFVKNNYFTNQQRTINIIASHPSGDDDLACAQYIKSIIEGTASISRDRVIERIVHSDIAKKFFQKNSPFIQEDIDYCIRELDTNFIMKVNKNENIPMVERINI